MLRHVSAFFRDHEIPEEGQQLRPKHVGALNNKQNTCRLKWPCLSETLHDNSWTEFNYIFRLGVMLKFDTSQSW